MWYGRRMEEMTPNPKNKNRLRDWAKPALFTAILYAGLAGGYFFYKKNTNQPTTLPPSQTNVPIAPSANPNINNTTVVSQENGDVKETVTIAPVSITKTVVDAMPIPESGNEQNTNARIFATTPNNQTTNSQTLAKKPTTPPAARPSADAPPLEPVAQEVAPAEPSGGEPAQPTRSKNSKEGMALTKAEAEAEAQNELLREAINKVRTLNDNKIAKSHEGTESSVAPHPPIDKGESNQDDTPKQAPKPPKVEKQADKVVIDQEPPVTDDETTTTE